MVRALRWRQLFALKKYEFKTVSDRGLIANTAGIPTPRPIPVALATLFRFAP